MECLLCFENYDHFLVKPYSLYPCGHTYCISCANKLTKCPMCKRIIRDKTPNYAVLQMITDETVQVPTALLTPEEIQPAMETLFKSKLNDAYFESYHIRLLQIIQQETNQQNKIQLIESEFENKKTKVFIGALISALCINCMDENKNLDHIKFKNHSELLSKYISHNKLFELEALLAVESLNHRIYDHLSDFLWIIFNILYDENIISEDVFWLWKREAQNKRHSMSIRLLESFFEALLLQESTQQANEDNTQLRPTATPFYPLVQENTSNLFINGDVYTRWQSETERQLPNNTQLYTEHLPEQTQQEMCTIFQSPVTSCQSRQQPNIFYSRPSLSPEENLTNKRHRKPILIVDPNTNKVVIPTSSASSSSSSTERATK